jgi:transcriptional regulator with XRE-family HTH domain
MAGKAPPLAGTARFGEACYRYRMISPAQCRAARGLLDWSQQRLAETANVGNATIRNFENGHSSPMNATLDVLQRALEAAGVEFTNGGEPGVKLKAKSRTIAAGDLNASNDE